MIWKIILFLLITFVSVAGIAFPIVENPQAWYEFPNIPGLEENAKIIFFHVPTAWLTLIAFLMSTIFSFKYLRKKDLDDDAKAYASVQLGMIFCILATVTGAIWAKISWGSFWSWDPRQTSITILLLIYITYFSLRYALHLNRHKEKICSIYLIFIMVMVPFFIFVLPRMFETLHPNPIINPDKEIHIFSTMRIVLFLSLISFTLLYFYLFFIKNRVLRISSKVFDKLDN